MEIKNENNLRITILGMKEVIFLSPLRLCNTNDHLWHHIRNITSTSYAIAERKAVKDKK